MKLTNKFNIPLSLAIWLAYDEYQHSDDPKVISATGLLKPLKSLILGQQCTSGEVDISELVNSRMGTAIHTAIEHAWSSKTLLSTMESLGLPQGLRDRILFNPDPEDVVEDVIPIYMEQRRTRDIEGWKITGQFDFICNGKLEDFKSTGTYNWINQSNKDKYIQQASIYRWLFPDIITQDLFSINYIFTDWSSVKARQDSKYPQKRLIQQDYELMPLVETERFIKDKLSKINQYLDKPQNQIPPCTDEELWLKPSVFKYYKNPANKTRSTKNFDSYWEAHNQLTQDGSVGEIVEVKGEVGFCRYCNAQNICNQAKQYINEGRLVV